MLRNTHMTESENRYDAIIRKLRENGYKLTPQRLAMVRVLAESSGHPDVETIYKKLQDQFPTMSLATVYRNIMLVKSLGEVLELGFADGSNRYDGKKPYPHPHIVCVRCRRIIDPDLFRIDDMTRRVTDETGFRILTHRLDFFGICPDCQASEPADETSSN